MQIGPTSTLSGDYTGSSTYQTDVTPGDVVLNCRGLRIGTGGTLIYEDGNGSPHTITVGDKEYVPFWIRKVLTGTTAVGILACY